MSEKTGVSIIVLLIAGVLLLSYSLMGIIPTVVFSVFLIGGFLLWWKTTRKYPVDPGKLIIPYLLTVIFFIIHVLEEYLTDFPGEMAELSGHHIPESNFLIVAAFSGPVLWLTGAVLLLLKNPIGYYITWGFFVAMVISELAHFVFPFMQDGRFGYFPGMYTALLPLIPAVVGIRIIFKEYSSLKAKS